MLCRASQPTLQNAKHSMHVYAAVRQRFFVLAALALIASAEALAQRPPNIVLVMMDDLGYGDVSSYGASDIRTPNIDRLAREGVRLTDAYANGPVCTPTRAALMTGMYPQRVRLEAMLTNSPTDQELGLAVVGTSLPALLKSRGYATGLVGKWHLGWKREFGPNAHGFDEFYGFLGGAHSYYTNRADLRGVGAGAPDLFENTTPVQFTGYLTDELARRSSAFIERHAEGPFFLEVAFNAVHWPFEPPDRPASTVAAGTAPSLRQTPDEHAPATRQDYVRMVERADQGIGEILATLDRLQLTNHTLVVFTNDNGGEWLSSNAPFFHRKGTLWEGGIRVPLILRWPGQLPSGTVSGQVAITTDISASILAAAGVRAPPAYRPDGIDILPILRGAEPLRERQLFWRWNRLNRLQRAVREGPWKLIDDAGQFLVFDLSTDPGERADLAARRPDRVASLKKLLDEWEAEMNLGMSRP